MAEATAYTAIVMDMQMPKLDGFEVLELLDPQPTVVFVTAYPQHAVEAFAGGAERVLMKLVVAADTRRVLGLGLRDVLGGDPEEDHVVHDVGVAGQHLAAGQPHVLVELGVGDGDDARQLGAVDAHEAEHLPRGDAERDAAHGQPAVKAQGGPGGGSSRPAGGLDLELAPM